MSLIINTVLLVFLLIIAIAVLRVRHLLAMIMLFGLYSLMVAGLFVVLDAPDVAFTEAAVGTGISTVLMLVTLASIRGGHEVRTERHMKVGPLLLALTMGGTLAYGMHDISKLGDPNAPAHQQVGKYYIEKGQEDTGVPNLVTAVLASYRGFDTLGEVTVVLTAGLGVLMLLRREKIRIKGKPDVG
jgi:multicomponent Na+:H+ antiporter subunit B